VRRDSLPGNGLTGFAWAGWLPTHGLCCLSSRYPCRLTFAPVKGLCLTNSRCLQVRIVNLAGNHLAPRPAKMEVFRTNHAYNLQGSSRWYGFAPPIRWDVRLGYDVFADESFKSHASPPLLYKTRDGPDSHRLKGLRPLFRRCPDTPLPGIFRCFRRRRETRNRKWAAQRIVATQNLDGP
jgi:hypothetical protein